MVNLMNRTVLPGLAVSLAAILAFAGCAKIPFLAKRSAPSNDRTAFAVAADKTPFYRYGPQQGNGPDRELTRGTVVTLIRRSFGYAKIRLDDGSQGFVANDDLARAPENLIAQVDNGTGAESSALPPTPEVALPVADPSPEVEPTPLPETLMPQ